LFRLRPGERRQRRRRIPRIPPGLREPERAGRCHPWGSGPSHRTRSLPACPYHLGRLLPCHQLPCRRPFRLWCRHPTRPCPAPETPEGPDVGMEPECAVVAVATVHAAVGVTAVSEPTSRAPIATFLRVICADGDLSRPNGQEDGRSGQAPDERGPTDPGLPARGVGVEQMESPDAGEGDGQSQTCPFEDGEGPAVRITGPQAPHRHCRWCHR
jgi:hypothetical protein